MGIVLIILIILILLTVSVGTYFVHFAIARKDQFNSVLLPEEEKKTETGRKVIIKKNVENFDTFTDEFLERSPSKSITIQSEDGLKLAGEFHSAESHRYAILIHGYMGNRTQMRHLAAVYSSWGFNTLLPDNRAHGESEGKWVGMGWLDKDDIMRWIDWIIQRDEKAEIILHGISMGGATVMMVSGMNLPDNVKAAVEDCGYTSAWDIFRDELKALFHLPSFPLLNMYSLMSRIIAGYSPKEASSLKMLRKSRIPMLFIHGGDDNFVGTYMLDINYEAKINGEKQKLLIEDAGHGEAYLRDPERYFRAVRKFIFPYLSEKP